MQIEDLLMSLPAVVAIGYYGGVGSLSLFKIYRSTQRLSTGRIPYIFNHSKDAQKDGYGPIKKPTDQCQSTWYSIQRKTFRQLN
jgi:hypothetical protein